MAKALSNLNVLQSARALSISSACTSYMRKKLYSLGFCNNHKVTIARKAPLGCPIEVEILDTRVMLRKAEAELILVQELS